MNLLEQISNSLAMLNYNFSAQENLIQERIQQYLLLIQKWNRIHNLTAIKKIEDMLFQHVMDSLSVLPHIAGPQIADVGSGAGLPGIPIALARPDWHVVLLESNHKKTAFLRQAKIELNLENIEIITKRVENLQTAIEFNTVITRAFSSLKKFINLAGHLCKENSKACRLVAMKSNCKDEDLKQVPRYFDIEKIITVTVPGLDAARCLIVIKKNNLFC